MTTVPQIETIDLMDPNIPTDQPISLVMPSLAQSVTPLPPPAPSKDKKHFPWMWIVGSVIVLILLEVGFVFFMKYQSFLHAPSSASSTTSGIPQAKITDLSPNVPNSQKTAVLVEHSDSSMEKFIMATDLVAGYLKALPKGDRVISQSPAGQ